MIFIVGISVTLESINEQEVRNDDLMPIDKMYVTHQLTKSELYELIDTLYLKDKINSDEDGNFEFTIGSFPKLGLQVIRLRKMYKNRLIEIELQPNQLHKPNGNASDYYGLTKLYEFVHVAERFDELVSRILRIQLPSFFHWNAKRVEYAVDLSVGQILLPKIITLFKRGNIPQYMMETETTQKYFHRDNNLYLQSPNITINFYNRYITIQTKEQERKKKFLDYTCTKGILRLEVQCRKMNKPVMEALSLDTCKRYIYYWFYSMLVGSGDHYRLEDALQMVSEKTNMQKKADRLIEVLQLVEAHRTIPAARQQFIAQNTIYKDPQDEFGKRLNQLSKLGVNPICLPVEWGDIKIENLHKRIAEHLYQDIEPKNKMP